MNKEHQKGDFHQLFDQITISMASEKVIKDWSYGEIKKPETINYRTFKPEKGGLFCEKIFGPTNDWECACGKYKKIKHKGIVCDRCGVEVTLSRVRRERMAHIELAVPVVHIWFFKTAPCRLGNLLEFTAIDLERIIYYEDYVVIDPGETTLHHKQLLTDIEYREAREQFGPDAFVADIGATAVRALLQQVDLSSLFFDLKQQLIKTKSVQARTKLAKRLKIIEDFHASSNQLEWMVMPSVPVIPPELRPLVPLDGGRFATSDLNDLYRRVINRNNRLKVILKLKTPDVIVRNEKRMLQEAVDALFDNGRHGHPVMGSGNRPLKSLAEMLKGKQGRFRQNLLGKRVDYSGRSVIVVGPELKLNQCGLPKQMALELFEPFIIRRLKETDHVYTIRSAKRIIKKKEPIVWEILEEIIQKHPVLLNRAPTLHRLGIQAFEPLLIEGKAIRVHPLVCAAFNADFDGDQMAVHIPLSIEAQLEAKVLMMPADNIFSPSSGKPLALPDKDIALGLYYLMQDPLYDPEEHDQSVKTFYGVEEVMMALYATPRSYSLPSESSKEDQRINYIGRGLHLGERIRVILDNGKLIETTPGRVIFNSIVPHALGFQNYTLPKKKIGELILDSYRKSGLEETVRFLDSMKNLGFQMATKGALSFGITDIAIPEKKKEHFAEAEKLVQEVVQQYKDGIITNGERYSKTISIWTEITDKVTEDLFDAISQKEGFAMQPLFMMIDSGARGNKSQIRQLGGLRGLMTKPSGEIIEAPIKSSFREGLTALEFFISSHGARKGLVDTALKTADSGYLTRRLVDVAQDVVVTEYDCETLNGIEIAAIKQGQEELLSLKDRLVGRTVCETIYMPGDNTQVIAHANDTLTQQQANQIDDAGIELIKVRSAITCEARRGICAKCYGLNLAMGKMASMGEAVGFIAAQSIGEPGTQLTMRTFHLGGVASAIITPEITSEQDGIVIYVNVRTVKDKKGQWLVLNKNGKLHVVKDQNRPLEDYKELLENKSIEPLQTVELELGAHIAVGDGEKVQEGEKLVSIEEHSIPIVCDRSGYVKYNDLVEGISTDRQVNKQTGQEELVVKQHQVELHPEINIYVDPECKELTGSYLIPSGAIIAVREGEQVEPGTSLARLPRNVIRTRDITGGLPRVAELFEARRPRNAAEIAKIDGVIELRGVQKNKRIVVVRDETSGMEETHLIPHIKHLIVQQGDYVTKGQQLTEGLVVPQEILEVCGPRELQRYLVNQVQEVYRLQGVDINDKHIEIIIQQMLKKVSIVDPGDTTLLYGEELDKKTFYLENQKIIAEGGKPAQAQPLLLGITKASLTTESFISAASFQDTTRILTEAVCCSKSDYLTGSKENVIIGHIVPVGTGYEHHQAVKGVYRKREEDKWNIDFSDDHAFELQLTQ